MGNLSKTDLEKFRLAIMKDHGLILEGDELYQAAFDLLKFFEDLVSFDKKSNQKEAEVQKLS
jgi:hypothetical protein